MDRRLGIEGVALDDETVANFMTSLRKSKLFKNVDLIVSEQIEVSKIPSEKVHPLVRNYFHVI